MCVHIFWCVLFFFFKQKTAYEMRISDWSSDVCSSDLPVKYGHCLSAERAAYRPVSEECRQPKDHLCVQQLWPQEEGRSIGQKWWESAYGIRYRSCVGLISSRPGGAHIHHLAK